MIMTTAELARIVGCSTRTVQRAIVAGEITADRRAVVPLRPRPGTATKFVFDIDRESGARWAKGYRRWKRKS